MSKVRTHLDDFAKLLQNPSHKLSVDVYNEDEKIKMKPRAKKHKSKYTLDQIGDALFGFIGTTNKRFDNIEKRLDNVETRLNDIDKRLDYNKLKKIA